MNNSFVPESHLLRDDEQDECKSSTGDVTDPEERCSIKGLVLEPEAANDPVESVPVQHCREKGHLAVIRPSALKSVTDAFGIVAADDAAGLDFVVNLGSSEADPCNWKVCETSELNKKSGMVPESAIDIRNGGDGCSSTKADMEEVDGVDVASWRWNRGYRSFRDFHGAVRSRQVHKGEENARPGTDAESSADNVEEHEDDAGVQGRLAVRRDCLEAETIGQR